VKLFPKITLASGKEHSLKRFHPWVFSGAIKRKEGEVNDGDIVEIFSAKNEFLGMGHYQNGSIAVRVFSFEQVIPDASFWEAKIQSAFNFRKKAGILKDEQTDVYRLVYAEGDGLPGLIIDIYNDTAGS
jgi:23S rRNA (cytosine1962-C5)-methyltransferase